MKKDKFRKQQLFILWSSSFEIIGYANGSDGVRLGERPFKFLAAWLSHGDFQSWMEKEWRWAGDLTCSLNSFREKLVCWNRDMFGNIHRRKRILQRRLEGVSK